MCDDRLCPGRSMANTYIQSKSSNGKSLSNESALSSFANQTINWYKYKELID
jgi:hypothetical protein